MPSVTQASRPISLTPRTICSTRSNAGPSFTSRHAAPMQNRVDPCSLARRAAASTSSTSSIFSAPTSVAWWLDCGQYAQSSGQPPVLTLSSVQSCT